MIANITLGEDNANWNSVHSIVNLIGFGGMTNVRYDFQNYNDGLHDRVDDRSGMHDNLHIRGQQEEQEEMRMAQVYCDYSECIYNDDGCCDREKIFLDADAMCDSFVYEPDEKESEEDEE